MEKHRGYKIRLVILGSFIISSILIYSMDTMTKIERISNPLLKTVKQQWSGNITINGRYYNDSAVVKSPLWSVLKWKLSSNPQKYDLTDEPMGEPIARLKAIAFNLNQTEKVMELPVGKEFYFNDNQDETE